ncbi:hypothetical protein WSTR_04615 [Wolbachia endosymbiont of Laodelphax striatellus]|nr:hypothetical protein WSTR_04615 [Wolbachia endosymbiont of Laodelphax striatellus]
MVNISIRYQIAQKVRSWRLKRGYTQKNLAGKIGVTYQIVLQYEKGTRKISIEKLYAIAEILSIGIVDLIPVSNEKICLKNEELNLIREYKKINESITKAKNKRSGKREYNT